MIDATNWTGPPKPISTPIQYLLIQAPKRSSKSANAKWTTDAIIAVVCTRCHAHIHVTVSAHDLNEQDPHDNHLKGSSGDSHRSHPKVAAAARWLDGHICIPGWLAPEFIDRIDWKAPRAQQLEAVMSVLAEVLRKPKYIAPLSFLDAGRPT